MPVDGRDFATEYEPQFVSTWCNCPNSQYGRHEDDCIHEPPKKPNALAGKRAWRRYERNLKEAKAPGQAAVW